MDGPRRAVRGPPPTERWLSHFSKTPGVRCARLSL
jgi:hypothetical protein